VTPKKFLPIILLVVGILVLGAVFFLIARSTKEGSAPEDESEQVAEVALADRPVASLIPTSDGHYLVMKIEKIKIPAKSLDYELLYSLPDGRMQGVPGTINLTGETTIERKLLLGSESSGKFRYDEGVSQGTLTLKFRNDLGKLVAKFSTVWHLQGSVTEVTSADDKVKLTLKKAPIKTFFVTMETFGLPVDAPAEVTVGPWGIFSSNTAKLAGTLDLGSAKTYYLSGSKWIELTPGSFIQGIFIGTE
jgi:hypothetical protein